jgi:hypothetical protein
MMNNIPKKSYMKPKVIHETKLEVRAGSVIPPGRFSPFNLPFPPRPDRPEKKP